MKMKFLVYLLILSSCSPTNQDYTSDHHADASDTLSGGLEDEFQEYLSNYEKIIDGGQLEISEKIKENYIKQALNELNDYYAYDSFSDLDYYYKTVLYKSDNMIAVTFNLSGDDGWNVHDVDFMITYSLKERSFVDVAMIRSNTDFEGYHNKGYNTDYRLDYELLNVADETVAFVLACSETRSYYNFNEEYYTEEEISAFAKGDSREFEYTVLSNGEILHSDI